MVERETAVEIGTAVAGVLTFIVALVAVGLSAGGPSLSGSAAYGLVGAVLLFILLMSAAGFWLATR
jgi:hypothetical protein